MNCKLQWRALSEYAKPSKLNEMSFNSGRGELSKHAQQTAYVVCIIKIDRHDVRMRTIKMQQVESDPQRFPLEMQILVFQNGDWL